MKLRSERNERCQGRLSVQQIRRRHFASRRALGRGLERLESRLCLSDVSGHIDADTTWGDTSEPYHLIGNVYVEDDATLTIAPGVTVTAEYPSLRLVLGDYSGGGTLDAELADLLVEIDVDDNSTVLIDQCELATIKSTGSTTVAGSTVGRLVATGDSSPVLTGNTFTTSSPVRVKGEDVPGLAANTFSVADTTVEVADSVVGHDTLWSGFPNVATYQLVGDVTVWSGATLSIAPGMAVVGSRQLFIGDDGSPGALEAESVNLATEIEVDDNATVLLDQCEVALIQSTGATTVTNSTIERLEVTGLLAPVLTGSTFVTALPVLLSAEYMPGLSAVTFSQPDTTVQVAGSVIHASLLWDALTNVTTYELKGNVEVKYGAILTIAPGLTVESKYSLYELILGPGLTVGRLVAESVELKVEVVVNFASTALIDQCLVSSLQSSGTTTVTNSIVSRLEATGNIPPVVTGNTFDGSYPVLVGSEYVSALLSNTFTGPNAWIEVDGTIDEDTHWPAIPNVLGYRIYTSVHVQGGATLTVAPGMTVTKRSLADILRVGSYNQAGTLDVESVHLASHVAVHGMGIVRIDQCEVDSLASAGDTTITDSTIGRLHASGAAPPVLSGNTFTTDAPLRIRGEYVPQLTANTFSVPDSTIEIHGADITTDIVWPDFPNVSTYQLEDDTRVREGSLTISPGMRIVPSSSGFDWALHVGEGTTGGSLHAELVDFAADVYVYDNATASIDQCEITLLHSTGDTTVTQSMIQRLEVLGDAPPVLVGNTFESDRPVRVLGEAVPGLAANTFNAPGTTVEIHGSVIDTVTLWPGLPNVAAFQLSSDVCVQGGTTLTVGSGATVTQAYIDTELHVGDDAIGGELDALGAVFNNEVFFYDNAGGDVRFSQFSGGAITIHDGSAVRLHENDFSGAAVVALGDPSSEIDLTNNYWGTADPLQIEDMILHQVDEAGRPLVLFEPFLMQPPEASTVMSRQVFYNDSKWDATPTQPNGDPEANEYDDHAIAPDPTSARSPDLGKTALLPGQTATFQNVTSYSNGINGIMVDVAGLADADNLSAADFTFKMGNDDDPTAWGDAPAPSDITVRAGVGVGDSDRVTIIWPNYYPPSPDPTTQAVAGQWLEVTVLPTANTGLIAADVFYFGNAPGDSGTGNTADYALVNAIDFGAVRNNPTNDAPIDHFADYNRDGRVNAIDFGLVRNNPTNPGNALKWIGVPAAAAPGPTPGGNSTELHDAALADLRWLGGLGVSSPGEPASDSGDPARAAVEKLLATL